MKLIHMQLSLFDSMCLSACMVCAMRARVSFLVVCRIYSCLVDNMMTLVIAVAAAATTTNHLERLLDYIYIHYTHIIEVYTYIIRR